MHIEEVVRKDKVVIFIVDKYVFCKRVRFDDNFIIYNFHAQLGVYKTEVLGLGKEYRAKGYDFAVYDIRIRQIIVSYVRLIKVDFRKAGIRKRFYRKLLPAFLQHRTVRRAKLPFHSTRYVLQGVVVDKNLRFGFIAKISFVRDVLSG